LVRHCPCLPDAPATPASHTLSLHDALPIFVGLKIADSRSFPASRLSGMKTQHLKPSRAACAETLFARLPVDAQASTLKPSSAARVAATETTRSLYERDG